MIDPGTGRRRGGAGRAVAGFGFACALLSVLAVGCGRHKVPSGPLPAGPYAAQSAGGAQVRVQLRLNCESICRNIARSCRQACSPQAWSPNMQQVQDSCEHDCDFNEFSCNGDCAGH
jgi:hypothetical protein